MSRKKRNNKKVILLILTVGLGGWLVFSSSKPNANQNLPERVNLLVKGIKAEEMGPEDILPEIKTGLQSENLPFTLTVKEPKGYEVNDVKLSFEAGNTIRILPVTKRCFLCKAKKYTVEGEIQNLTAGEWKLTTNYGGRL